MGGGGGQGAGPDRPGDRPPGDRARRRWPPGRFGGSQGRPGLCRPRGPSSGGNGRGGGSGADGSGPPCSRQAGPAAARYRRVDPADPGAGMTPGRSLSRATEVRVTGGSRRDDFGPPTASFFLPVVVRGPSSHSGGTSATVGSLSLNHGG